MTLPAAPNIRAVANHLLCKSGKFTAIGDADFGEVAVIPMQVLDQRMPLGQFFDEKICVKLVHGKGENNG